MPKVSIKGWRLPGLVTTHSTLKIWLQASSPFSKNWSFPRSQHWVWAHFCHIFSDTALLSSSMRLILAEKTSLLQWWEIKRIQRLGPVVKSESNKPKTQLIHGLSHPKEAKIKCESPRSRAVILDVQCGQNGHTNSMPVESSFQHILVLKSVDIVSVLVTMYQV